MLTLIRCHRTNECFNRLECIVVYFHIFNGFANTGNHSGQVFYITHLLDLLNLSEEVIIVKLVFCYLLLKTLCFFFIELLLGTFNERNDVTHAKDAVCHSIRMEHVKGLPLFACTHKLDGLVHNGADREGCTATGVSVKFGENHSINLQTLIESLSSIDCILSCHGIYNEQGLVGLDCFLDLCNLLYRQSPPHCLLPWPRGWHSWPLL